MAGYQTSGIFRSVVIAAGTLLGMGAASAEPVSVGGFPTDTLNIVIPASPGGGFDATARSVQGVLQKGIAAKSVSVENVSGAGGTIGLAKLLNEYTGNGHGALLMGLSVVGPIYTNKAPVNLDSVTPVARLTMEYEAVAVGNDSKYKTIQDLVAAFKADPKAVVWGGGPGGSPDHMTVGLLAKAAGVDPSQINYVAFSGGQARSQIMGNQVAAGVVGFGELKADMDAKLLRVLAISGPERLPGIDIPTFKEAGIDVDFTNWRGIVAAPGISEDARKVWVEMISRVRNSEEWRAILKQRDWQDAFLPGDEFGAFLKAESKRVSELVVDLGLAGK